MSQDVHEERVILTVKEAEKLKAQLVKQGCVFSEQAKQQETYLEQPPGEVLKIVEQDGMLTLVRLHENDGKLDVVREKPLSDKQAQDLKEHYPATLTLANTVTTYTYGEITLRVIENEKGAFLTLQAETIGDEVYEELELKKDNILKTSFAFL